MSLVEYFATIVIILSVGITTFTLVNIANQAMNLKDEKWKWNTKL